MSRPVSGAPRPDRLPPIWLVRHGETVWNREGRLHGALDAPLTDLGRRQAGWLRDLLPRSGVVVLTSPQGRARQTARLIFHRAVPAEPALAEIGIGDFAGRLLSDLRAAHPQVFAGGDRDWYDRCPGGEGLDALERRCQGLLDRLTAPTVLVTHGATLCMLRSLALGRGRADLWQGGMGQGIAHHLHRGREAVLRPSDLPHRG